MGKAYSKLQDALDSVGAKLKRDKKHLVYELPNGRNFVVAQTPSDTRGELNAISDLRAAAGVDVKPERRKAAPDVRAERRRRPGRAVVMDIPKGDSPLASALRDNGFVEAALRQQIEVLQAGILELTATVDELSAANRALQAQIDAVQKSWLARLGGFVESLNVWRR